jgi:hypothetical protein
MVHIDTVGENCDIAWRALNGALVDLVGREIFGF